MGALIRRGVIAALLVVGGSAAAQARDFILENRTGYDIYEVYVSPRGQNLWGPDILGLDVLGSDDSTAVSFPSPHGYCMQDLKVAYGNGQAHEWYALNLCAISYVILHYDPDSGRTWAEVGE